ncbi:hypothetical protein [Youngiibacter multivorans]|uniref:Uncharacterized protein YneF (UPF0154 family) n=1 Tax=Youngiibacter multivorans TaxID=937251 RepID=A0ABS4G5C8_9CLOT|nr:hypothetical protein [Youngiibacter multivorans]MBP1919744.1 uncharacterized protein YneF (UPF0154 family) [Youngiibacter multivorans]
MKRKILTVLGSVFIVFVCVIAGAFIGMSVGGNIRPEIEFNGAYGYEAGGQIGELIGLAIGLYFGYKNIMAVFRDKGSQEKV